MEMVGTTSLGTKESILEQVFERLDVDSEEVESDADVSGEEDEQDEGEDALSGGSADDDALTHASVHGDQTFSLHQAMYTPLVRLPRTLGSSKVPYVYEGYRRAPTSISLAPDDPLLPLDADEDALADELRQEEELNAHDKIVADKNENVLWGEYRRRGTRGAVVAKDEEADSGYALRFKARGVDGLKSQVYVVDSDSE
jgi:hypothetical protein